MKTITKIKDMQICFFFCVIFIPYAIKTLFGWGEMAIMPAMIIGFVFYNLGVEWYIAVKEYKATKKELTENEDVGQIVITNLYCEKCNGKMLPDGCGIFMGRPLRIPHKCTECGHCVNADRTYPSVKKGRYSFDYVNTHNYVKERDITGSKETIDLKIL